MGEESLYVLSQQTTKVQHLQMTSTKNTHEELVLALARPVLAPTKRVLSRWLLMLCPVSGINNTSPKC